GGNTRGVGRRGGEARSGGFGRRGGKVRTGGGGRRGGPRLMDGRGRLGRRDVVHRPPRVERGIFGHGDLRWASRPNRGAILTHGTPPRQQAPDRGFYPMARCQRGHGPLETLL